MASSGAPGAAWSSWQEALTAVLKKIEQGHAEEQRRHLELLQAIDRSATRKSGRSEAWAAMPARKSAPAPSASVGRERLSLRPAPSLQEMQNATRQALTDSFSLFQSFSAPSFRNRISSVSEGDVGGPVVPVPAEREQGPGPPKGLIFHLPQAYEGGTMQSMAKQSQAQILSTASHNKDVGYGLSLRFLTTYPRCLAMAVAVPSVIQLACMSWLALAGHANHAAFALNLVSTGVYAVLAIASITLLDKAWRSSHFEVAVARLHTLMEDFKIEWSLASAREWRKYTAAWFFNIAGFVAIQVLQAWVQQGEADVQGIEKSWIYIIGALTIVSCGISSGVVLLTAFIQTDLFLGLDKSLDCWCCQIVNHNMDFGLGVETWNAVQALLKSVARELASSFLALQILSGLSFVYFLAIGMTFVFRSEHHPLPLLVEGLSSLPLVSC